MFVKSSDRHLNNYFFTYIDAKDGKRFHFYAKFFQNPAQYLTIAAKSSNIILLL